MVKIGNISPLDERFWPNEPEPGFNPERNRQVIEGTIKKYEQKRARQMGNFVDNLRERTDAVASFFKKKDWGYSGGVRRYFGKRYLAKLRGEDIISSLRASPQSLANLRGLVVRGKGFRVDKDPWIEHDAKEKEKS